MATPEQTPEPDGLAPLFALTRRDEAAPDAAQLRRIREQTLPVFETTNATTRLRWRGANMPFLLARGIAAALILGLGLAVFLYAWLLPNPQGGGSLADESALGKVVDVQGVVGIKPVTYERWTPVRAGLSLRIGDWVRSDVRGANAATIQLGESKLILGPDSLIEVQGANRVQLVHGELAITPAPRLALELVGPDKQQISIQKEGFVRVEKEQLARVEKEPLWLKGYKEKAPVESMGSLIVKVDGRNLELTVGYHKVFVEIRDQIARTTIEQSFVNRTDQRMEGIFHFPLPPDASISGFGMWIGNELVEADIVEKQRAREIYEEILRERRDPGLLEWTGGSIFKARVFPIEPRSEKRIKISYTQVLPMRGSKYRYGYGLMSDLLRQHPVRELSIDVKLHSAVPLNKVTCPTHPARINTTHQSAHVEFTRSEYVPTKDFEVVVETATRPGDVTLIPHQRGTDGYFLLQLQPPDGNGSWERELVPNGESLRLLILADTSASMDASQRASQRAFIAALLGALTPKDYVNLATCDMTTDWVFPDPVVADAANVTALRDRLQARISLGWTDLDKAFAALTKQVKEATHVVYVGDGVVTTGEADAAAFALRLRNVLDESIRQKVTCHAVGVGNSVEPTVLRAIGSLGGGSYRRVTGEQGPQGVALELLSEIAQPTLRDVRVEFRGIRTARVYPSVLPNVPTGTQQIILGRYLPEGKDQSGEVIVTGTQNGQPVRFTSKVSLRDAEAGNSFIPRLWARMHLDFLLEQGRTEAIKQQIIDLSEEYQIMTPYTSFLVLENDADRERFRVQRQMKMRDGEDYFAKGRENANYDLVQKQMRLAGTWRTQLRQRVLQQMANLGRNANFRHAPESLKRRYRENARDRLSTLDSRWLVSETRTGLGMDFDDAGLTLGDINDLSDIPSGGTDLYFAVPVNMPALGTPADGLERLETVGIQFGEELDDLKSTIQEFGTRLDGAEAWGRAADGWGFAPGGGGGGFGNTGRAKRMMRVQDFGGDLRQPVANPFAGIYPTLSNAPRATSPAPSHWPAEASALAQSLLRRTRLANLQGGLRIVRATQTPSRRNPNSPAATDLVLAATDKWLTRYGGAGEETIVHWADVQERGVLSRTLLLGQVRQSKRSENTQLPLELGDFGWESLELQHQGEGWQFKVERQGDNQQVLTITHEDQPDSVTRCVIDTLRHVLLRIERVAEGKTTSITRFDDFVEVANCWWPRLIENVDDQGRTTRTVRLTIDPLSAEQLTQEMAKELATRPQAHVLQHPLPTVAQAKKARHNGTAKAEDHLVLTFHFGQCQQWARVREHLAAVVRLASDKPGLRWLQRAVLAAARERDQLRGQLLDEAAELAKTPDAAEAHALARRTLSLGQQVLGTNEMLALLERIKPVFLAAHHGDKEWANWQLPYLARLRPAAEIVQRRGELAQKYPDDLHLQLAYAQGLSESGQHDDAYNLAEKVVTSTQPPLDEVEAAPFLLLQYQLLERQGRHADVLKYLEAWMATNPKDGTSYTYYLTNLFFTEQEAKAEALMRQWLNEAKVAGRLPGPVLARLHAALQQILGNGYQRYVHHTNAIDEKWMVQLGEVTLHFGRSKHHLDVAQMIMRTPFVHTKQATDVRKQALTWLTNELAQLKPEQAGVYIDWLQSNDPVVAAETWKGIAQGLRQRWENAPTARQKDAWSNVVATVLRRHVGQAEVLAFLRLKIEKATDAYRQTYRHQLFEELLSHAWSKPKEDEALALLPLLGYSRDPVQRFAEGVETLHRLTDVMVSGRQQSLLHEVKDLQQLPKREQNEHAAKALKQARMDFADRLGQFRATLPANPADRDLNWQTWLVLEEHYLDVLAEHELDKAMQGVWALLGDKPATLPTAAELEDLAPEELTKIGLRGYLQQRCVTTLLYLSTRPDAVAANQDRLLQFLRTGSTATEDGERWKSWQYQLLVALNRPKDLEEQLQVWSQDAAGDVRWRIALGYVQAEQGKIPEAIQSFEAVKSDDELGPTEYRTMAGWYQVANQRERHEQANLAVYEAMPDGYLLRDLQIRLNPWRGNGPLPSELDLDVLRAFQVGLTKSSYPQQYVPWLGEYYRVSRDFRLLATLAEGMVGHTAERIYPVLSGLKGLLDNVHEEATVDRLVAHAAEVRKRAKSDVDHRALDLLEVVASRRAAELRNQPSPHAQAAFAALQRAFQRPFTEGEPRHAADFLVALGKISEPQLAQEQVRRLQAIYQALAIGSADRLAVANGLAQIEHQYERTEVAIDLLRTTLREVEAAEGGILPAFAQSGLEALVSYLEAVQRFAQAETELQRYARRPLNNDQALWLKRRLFTTYNYALRDGGATSLGSGLALYKALVPLITKEFESFGQDHRMESLRLLVTTYQRAHEKKLAGVPADVEQFATVGITAFLARQYRHYREAVNAVGSLVANVFNHERVLVYYLDRMEKEPAWVVRFHGTGWHHYAPTLAYHRFEAKKLSPATEERLLAVVLAALKRDLEYRQQENRSLYARHVDQYFWKEKANDFARVAAAVLKAQQQSEAHVLYVADYLYHALGRRKEAIAALVATLEAKRLSDNGLATLVSYWHDNNQFAESIPVLEGLMARHVNSVNYRVQLMRAYFKTQRLDDVRRLLAASEKHYRDTKNWNEPVIAQLAASALANGFYKESVDYYQQAIKIREEGSPRRGVGQPQLAGYYEGLSQAHVGLKQWSEAVQSANAAIVVWGARHEERKRSLDNLKSVLRQTPDLKALLAQLDAKAEETGLHSPIVRKALGEAFLAKKDLDAALTQLRLAAELQPNDQEIHQLLVKCYDERGDKEGAIRQLHASLELSRRDVGLFKDLAARYDAQQRPAEAERARTSIVEMLAQEAEGHAALAEIREKQERWPEAIEHWRRAATLRALEPTNLIHLAEAQIQAGQREEARTTLKQLTSKSWPPRFDEEMKKVPKLQQQAGQ